MSVVLSRVCYDHSLLQHAPGVVIGAWLAKDLSVEHLVGMEVGLTPLELSALTVTYDYRVGSCNHSPVLLLL